MSELKAQVLGILLVIALFGTVATMFSGIVSKTNSNIENQYSALETSLKI